MNRLNTASSNVASTGFMTQSSMPSARNLSLPSFNAYAETPITGVLAILQLAFPPRKAVNAPSPSMTGIRTSMNTSSNRQRDRCSRALAPSSANVTEQPVCNRQQKLLHHQSSGGVVIDNRNPASRALMYASSLHPKDGRPSPLSPPFTMAEIIPQRFGFLRESPSMGRLFLGRLTGNAV